MKCFVLACIMLAFVGSTGAAQTEKPKVRGIASYAIGESRLDRFLFLLDSIGVKPMKESNFFKVLLAEAEQGFVIAEIVRDGDLSDQDAPRSSHVRVFYVTKITVGSLEIPRLYLFFYDGVLFRLRFDLFGPAKEGFRMKYGDGERTSETVKVECARKGSAYKMTYDVRKIDEVWTNGSIKGRLGIGEYYDENCEKHGYSIMTVEDVAVSARVKGEEQTIKDAERKARETKIREETKGL